jgi:hypothetical protein
VRDRRKAPPLDRRKEFCRAEGSFVAHSLRPRREFRRLRGYQWCGLAIPPNTEEVLGAERFERIVDYEGRPDKSLQYRRYKAPKTGRLLHKINSSADKSYHKSETTWPAPLHHMCFMFALHYTPFANCIA